MKKMFLFAALLVAVGPLGGCALLAAGVAGAVIERQVDGGWCYRHPYDEGCRYYFRHQREYREYRHRGY